MFQVRLLCCLGLKSRQSVSINVDKTRKHFARNTHSWRVQVFPQCFSVFHTGNIASTVSFLFSRCKLCLYATQQGILTKIRACEHLKILRARASKHSSNFSEHFEQRPNFASTFHWMGPFDTPSYESRIQ